ncbi:MAG: YggS family pyridoxal phosphate-dependent enzyme [Actinomycetota bacterium]
MIEPAAVAAGADRVRDRVAAAGGDPDAITLIAMTKGFGADAVRAALQAGLDRIGENYAQELTTKAAEVDGPEWHFLGRLQRNKVRVLAPLVSLWQSVDRLELGDEIAKRAPGAPVLVQVNVSGEPQKGGCPPTDTPALVEGLRARRLEVRGLMTIGPTGPPEAARLPFRALAALARRLDLDHVSMGMTDDVEVAVQEGSTMIRVGRGLFGPRP